MTESRVAFAVALLLALGCSRESNSSSARAWSQARDSLPTAQHAAPARPALPPPSAAVRQELCQSINNSGECALAVERYLLSQPGVQVRRRGRDLEIPIVTGARVLLRDSTADESASLQYTYGGYIAEVHSHLVEVGYYEGGAWELVNFRTGTRQHFDGPPIPAPDSTHLAVVSSDLEAQYVPTTIQVWRMGQDTAVLEWRLDPNGAHRSGYSTGDWGPTGAAWRSSDTILIHTEMLGEHGASASETVTVVRTKTGWALVAPPVTPN